MKKHSQNNRSALISAGEKSLLYMPQEMSDSRVHQVYKRQGTEPQQRQAYYEQQNYSGSKLYGLNERKNHQHLVSHLEMDSIQKPKSNYRQHMQSHSRYSDTNNEPLKLYNASNSHNHYRTISDAQTKQLMMKLTLPRLRKMQALVRGFLVRRKVYPPLLKEYLIAKSTYDLILANVMYKQISSIIMEAVTFPKYELSNTHAASSLGHYYQGEERMLEEELYDLIIRRVIRKDLKPIIEESVTSRGLLMSRPEITFGFNLRSPIELLMYEKLMGVMREELKQISQETIAEVAFDKRELFVVDQWIEKYNMLQSFYEEVANEVLEESIGEYIVEDIIQNVNKEAAFVVTEGVYTQTVNSWYLNEIVEKLKQEAMGLILEEAVGKAVLQLGYGMENISVETDQNQKLN